MCGKFVETNEIRLTHVARHKKNTQPHRGWRWSAMCQVRKSFATNQEEKKETISLVTIQSQQFSKLNDVCSTCAVLCSTSIKIASWRNRVCGLWVCVYAVHRVNTYSRFTQTIMLTPYVAPGVAIQLDGRTLSKNHLCKNFNNFVVAHTHASAYIRSRVHKPKTKSTAPSEKNMNFPLTREANKLKLHIKNINPKLNRNLLTAHTIAFRWGRHTRVCVAFPLR